MELLSYPFGINPVPGYRFTVFLNERIMGFRKVSGMVREIETETYREGGLNTKVHVFPKQWGGEQVLKMEKGVYGGVGHPFYLVGERIPGVMELIVMDHYGRPLKCYLFSGLIVKKWEIAELSAESGSLLIDHFEVGYEDFQAVI